MQGVDVTFEEAKTAAKLRKTNEIEQRESTVTFAAKKISSE